MYKVKIAMIEVNISMQNVQVKIAMIQGNSPKKNV